MDPVNSVSPDCRRHAPPFKDCHPFEDIIQFRELRLSSTRTSSPYFPSDEFRGGGSVQNGPYKQETPHTLLGKYLPSTFTPSDFSPIILQYKANQTFITARRGDKRDALQRPIRQNPTSAL